MVAAEWRHWHVTCYLSRSEHQKFHFWGVNMAVTTEQRQPHQREAESNPLSEFQHHVKEACDMLRYPESVFDLLKEPIRFFTVRIPVRMDDGTTKTFTGYRAQHITMP